MRSMRRHVPLALVVLLAAAFILGTLGCAKHKEETDPFFDKWKTMATNSTGFSPSRETRDIKPRAVLKQDKVAEEQIEQARPLPTVPVTLKLHNVDVGVALRSLAAAAGKNIILSPGVKGSVNVNVNRVPWSDVFKGMLDSNGLDYAWQGELIKVMTMADKKVELERTTLENQRMAQKLKGRKVGPLITTVLDVRYAEAAELKKNLEGFLSKDEQNKSVGSVVVDTFTNSLIIQAVEDDQKKLMTLVSNLDKPRAQIHLKAHIVEATKETARELGIQWGGVNRVGNMAGSNDLWVTPGGTGGKAGTSPYTGSYTPIFGAPGISGQGNGINFPIDTTGKSGAGSLGLMFGTIGGNMLEMQLSALQENSKINILSSPSISTLDNQMAYTENGEKVPYVSTNAQGDREVKFEDAVLRLEITPHVIDDKNLKLKVLVKKDEVDLTRTVEGNPFIIKKQTETTLIVQDGETIVISGLTKDRKSTGRSGIPGLHDVEGLGWLFGSDSKGGKLEEVLIFITPAVLPYREMAEQGATQQITVQPGQMGQAPTVNQQVLPRQ
ncbi:type IV pilus secretin PilQ [Desulfovibrio oxamicus]|uniref:Type IV pilus secretin PilQ n=1 Tax=Nitratidesulfovibrio oxamicus TaxID=32016 RepID=A0ABS0IZS9_9BACT|nr:type IV pilus secretin PilQ [Nitratidesulfovibrio oxamicus]